MGPGHSRYTQIDVTTASPEVLVAKLYQAAIRHTRRAKELSGAGQPAERGVAIQKATAIVQELQVSLDRERGGEIARNMASLYDFVVDRLLEGNLRAEARPLEEAVGILETLEDAWSQILGGSAQGATP